jgi:hypothetical protein
MKLEVKLGQRVYGVTKNGYLVPTLISEIELTDTKLTQSEFEKSFDIGLNGVSYSTSAQITFRVLSSGLESTHLSFDEACETALLKLETLVNDDQLTVRQQNDLQAWHKRLLADTESVRTELSEVSTFSKSRDLYPLGMDSDSVYTESDFPKTYIEPGTPVWIADTKDWKLIRGMVTAVHFAKNWKRHTIYYCGRFSNNSVDVVFKTKRKALNYLEAEFQKKLPGTLNRSRVEIEFQHTEVERKRLQMKRIEHVADSLMKAGHFKQP